ncbi:unnamed protein product [Parnassius apollo]|uniref:(apollo) hypothetical protein n=1 Tax=Parnassius apollo TaxID=110799 RepID=A0A8S3WK12_PARAO|nr:unnamed protein product [Parnassius apollo]
MNLLGIFWPCHDDGGGFEFVTNKPNETSAPQWAALSTTGGTIEQTNCDIKHDVTVVKLRNHLPTAFALQQELPI